MAHGSRHSPLWKTPFVVDRRGIERRTYNFDLDRYWLAKLSQKWQGQFKTLPYITWDHAQEYALLSLFYLDYLLEDTLYERNCAQVLNKQEENLPISVQSTRWSFLIPKILIMQFIRNQSTNLKTPYFIKTAIAEFETERKGFYST